MRSNYNKKNIIKCSIGKKTVVWDFVNMYECSIGNDCIIGSFVEIQKGVKVGNNVKIQSFSFLCEGVTIEDNVFIGHHVVFTNDKYPRSTNKNGKLKNKDDWEVLNTLVKKGASIGSNATILPGITIGENSIVGAGSVVTHNVNPNVVVVGNPAKEIRKLSIDNK